MLGIKLGGVFAEDRPRFYRWLAFVNEMNTGNPDFEPYDIPKEYRRK